MVAINLFREPQFGNRLHRKVPCTHVCALLAAISAYAAQFCPEEVKKQWDNEGFNDKLPSEHFQTLALAYVDEALKECGDEPPSLCILQALVIATHLQLTQGVRGKAWRSLGTCVRLAYELNLHLIDFDREQIDNIDVEKWCWREEKRRAWWAIWEMDVFASTIRRTPSAIDWSQMETLLPVEDKHWFSGRVQPSCFMERDPIHRWKALHVSGNRSPKAWFLVINSLMKDAQTISSPRSIPNRTPCHKDHPQRSGLQDGLKRITALSDEANQKLETLANSVQCFSMVLPDGLRYRDQYLSFEARAHGQLSSKRQDHCSIYNIYVMVQLANMMIHRYDVFQSLRPRNKRDYDPGKANPAGPTSQKESMALSQYFEAADYILTIVSRRCDVHIRYINPFLSSTIWLAPAIQIFRQEFEHGETRRTFIRSKFELLHMTYKQCVSWWKINTALQQNLETLETHLESYRKFNDSPRSHHPRTSKDGSEDPLKKIHPRPKALLPTESNRDLITIEGVTPHNYSNTLH